MHDHILDITFATHLLRAWHICKNYWRHVFLISCSVVRKSTEKEKCTIEWERQSELEAEKLKPFLRFVAEPRFFSSLLPIPWYCLFFGVQSLATKSHFSQLPLTECIFIRNGPLSSKTLVLARLRRKWAIWEITLLPAHMAAQTAIDIQYTWNTIRKRKQLKLGLG